MQKVFGQCLAVSIQVWMLELDKYQRANYPRKKNQKLNQEVQKLSNLVSLPSRMIDSISIWLKLFKNIYTVKAVEQFLNQTSESQYLFLCKVLY